MTKKQIKNLFYKELIKKMIIESILDKALSSNDNNIDLTSEQHDEVANEHLTQAINATTNETRDKHMSEALEHIFNSKSNKHNKKYKELMNQFYPTY